jgi:lipoprotein-anchoring transpeptidase ErfK/SrfK
MNSDAAGIAERLRLGIDAARAGRNDQAQIYLSAVLEQEPDNIPALFWSAFVAPMPQESVNLLQRVLTLDPNNERAKAGLNWARQRLDKESAAQPTPPEPEPEYEAGETKPTPAQPVEEEPEMPDEFIREQLLARKDMQQRAKKGALAHRARRTIDPLLVVTIILGAAIVLTAGIWIVVPAPTETLAAWLPVATVESVPANIPDPPAINFVSEAEQPETEAAQNFSSTSDVLPEQAVKTAVETTTNEASVAEHLSEKTTQQSVPVSTDPNSLIGPASASIDETEKIVSSEESPETTAPAASPQEPNEPAEAEQPAEEDSQENPAVSGSIDELVESADEVLNGPKLFEPVDESLLAHQPAFPGEKWIEVDVTLQQITAWEGNVPVMHFIGSTGLPNTPTVLGEYNVYWKLESTLMAGADYYLPNVPYTMYFYGGYAIHGTYWHENFGQPMSHGCVNLTTENAKQIFEWADPILPEGQTQVTSTADNPGTLVVVHQ